MLGQDPPSRPVGLLEARETAHGMEARHLGPREPALAGLHPNAKKNLEQVYAQIWKDVKKHRVLVASQDNPCLGNTMASPFEAVPASPGPIRVQGGESGPRPKAGQSGHA